MKTPLEELESKLPYLYFTDKTLALYLHESTANSRHALVKRALASGLLLQLRRGVYCFERMLHQTKKTNAFAIAPYLYGSSYISFESALSYHQWIPEYVPTIISASTKRTRSFQTPIGIFQFYKLPTANFFCEVSLKTEEKENFLIASPLKAICDLVYIFKKNWTGAHPLLHSLRIEEECLKTISIKELLSLDQYYQSKRLSKFLTGLASDLK
jgi:predicted transcriptional regulator of viral defense system